MTVEDQPIQLTEPDTGPPHMGTAFLREAWRTPREIGAIAPSGPRLAAHAAGQIATDSNPQVVLELGPGSGAITDALHARLPDAATLIAIEINTAMVKVLQQTRPWLKVLHGDAADLPALLAAEGIDRADVIVSALPWSIIPNQAQEDLLEAILGVLKPRGVFATVLTLAVLPLPRVRRLHRRLRDNFGTVTHRTEWRNPPPARLVVCRNPLPR